MLSKFLTPSRRIIRSTFKVSRSFGVRVESDLIGEKRVPEDAYYGVQTMRGIENYNITGVKLNHFPNFIRAFAMIKKACAEANGELGIIKRENSEAICKACDEILAGKYRDQFLIDMIQGGAGTSTNMNVNEVIANRALEILKHEKGEYQYLSPNDDVNKCQSTNDTYPSAAKIGIALENKKLVRELNALIISLKNKGDEFEDVIKMGRTQLQDAVPMTMKQEFYGYARTLESDLSILKKVLDKLVFVNLGGTAIGTKTASHPQFSNTVVPKLRNITNLPIELADNLVAASSSTGTMLLFHTVIRRLAVKTSQICNDLRLMSSGPRCGLNEINLPAMAPGSSIMPGKVNPVIPEVVNQTCFQIIGADETVTLASQAGQLELNVMEPVIIFNIFQSTNMLCRAIRTLRTKCVEGITANKEKCYDMVKNSIGIVTCLLPYIGYKNCTQAAKKALKENKSVGDVLVELNFLSEEEVKSILRPAQLVKPNYIVHDKK